MKLEEAQEKKVEVYRNDLLFRVLHWSILVEGVLLTLSGFQLGGNPFNFAIFPTNALSYHIMIGFVFISTATLFIYDIAIMGDMHWWGPKRFVYSIKYVMAESKAWLKLGPKVAEPIKYDTSKHEYVEKIIPSVIMVFWIYVVLGLLLMFTGLALAFPASFGFVYTIVNPIGTLLVGFGGLSFVLAIHLFAAEILIVVVMLHAYAVSVFKLVKPMITGKRMEKAV
jgi:methanophenazine hydrogenase, cytochrome b subunit